MQNHYHKLLLTQFADLRMNKFVLIIALVLGLNSCNEIKKENV